MSEVEDGKSAVIAIQQLDASILERERDLGEVNKFTDVAGTMASTVRLWRLVDPIVLDLISIDQHAKVIQIASQILNLFKQVADFHPQMSDAANVRQNIHSQAKKCFEQAHAQLPPLMAESARLEQVNSRVAHEALMQAERAQIDTHRKELTNALSRVEKTSRASEEHVSRIDSRVEETLRAARDAALQHGVQFQAGAFKTAGESHTTSAQSWLSALFVFAAVLVAWACFSPWMFAYLNSLSSAPIPTEQIIAAKVLGFAVLSFIVVVCARSYFAHRHNAIVNLHRQNALITYRALVEASASDANREVILQHAASCIFGPQASGYSRDGKGGPPTVHNVIETLGNRIAGTDHQ